jgi:hypothetical protein
MRLTRACLECGLVGLVAFVLGCGWPTGWTRGLAQQGLTHARGGVIWRLGQHGPMTRRALSTLLHITPAASPGWWMRSRPTGCGARDTPTDRRATLVRLTGRGGVAARQMGAGYRELAERLLGDLSAVELGALIEVLDRMLERLRAGEAAAASG